MREITFLLNSFREASRVLWNNFFRTDVQAPERVDEFDRVRLILFRELVLSHLGAAGTTLAPELSLDHFVVEPVDPVLFIRVQPVADHLPLFVNRDQLQGPYWDAEPRTISANDCELAFIDYFDFDAQGFRDFRYYRVRLERCRNHPNIAGRNALIAVEHARLFVRADS